MTLAQIEKNLNEVVTNFNTNTFIYDFLLALNANKSDIQRLKKGQLNISKIEGEILWKKKIFYKVVATANIKQALIETMVLDGRIEKNKIRFVIASDNTNIAALDNKTQQTIYLPIADLVNEIAFFLPLAGMEKYTAQAENDADVKAAVQMAKLFDEIKKTNPTNTIEEVHNLNIFLSRLLFCFFAEDTGIFKKDLFKNYIFQYTFPDGSNLQQYLQELFVVLNTLERNSKTPFYAKDFPYVNGGLFSATIPLPAFTSKSRLAILASAGEYWADINPDIFGSMIQAVVTPDKRGNLGMHYTSVPNIMKVIKPLFLDELYEEFETAKNNPAALNKLLGRMANIHIFDPACGSGNFLIIAYKELRLLEIKILLQLKALQSGNSATTGFEEKQQALFGKQQLTLADSKPQVVQMELFSRIELNHFFGIELDDFAHEVAKLSLWLAQHQMNVEFNKLIGTNCNTLPLSDAGVIIHGNATRLDWEVVCPKPKVGEVFILGNPPYLGFNMQSIEQYQDIQAVLPDSDNLKFLDYISCWFIKASQFIDSKSQFAFVTTNSVCQGTQVPMIWPQIFALGLEINFAYPEFPWANNAKNNAAVICSIIGVRVKSQKPKYLYTKQARHEVKNINAYLVNGGDTIVEKRQSPLSKLSNISTGNIPYDGGNLILSTEEKDELISRYPEAKVFIKNLSGSKEYINDLTRYCLWIENDNLALALLIPPRKEKIDKVRKSREEGGKIAKNYSNSPHRFYMTNRPKASQILIPRVSSIRRDYIPTGFLNRDTIISDSAQAIYDPEQFVFAVINSRMHMVWVRALAGRLKSDYRYSAVICYNTFPFPPITEIQKAELETHVYNILEQRAKHTEKTLAELYDPEKMPEGLLTAHQNLDIAIEKCYRDKPFENDEERLAHLFKLYEEMIAAEPLRGTLFEGEVKIKKSKKK
jgi:hypothetical protein